MYEPEVTNYSIGTQEKSGDAIKNLPSSFMHLKPNLFSMIMKINSPFKHS